MSAKAPRPPAVVSACLFVGLSSALLLYYTVGWLTSWNTIAMQELHADIADAAGISDIDRVADLLRYALLALVVVLVAGVVGALYTARGDRASRVLVTVVAIVTAILFVLTGGLLGVLPGAFAVAAVVQLRGADARHWFAVVNGLEPPARPQPPQAVRPPVPGVQGPSHPQASDGGPASPQAPAAWQQAGGWAAPHPWGPPPPDPNRAPSSVRTAVLVTAIASFAALGLALLYLLLYVLVPTDDLVQAQLDSPIRDMVEISESEIRQALRSSAAISGVTVALSVAALLAALAMHRRVPASRTMLFVLAVVTIVVGSLTIVGLPWAGAAVWVLVLLRRPEVSGWLSGGRKAQRDV